METRTLSLPDAEIVHDVHGPLPPADGGEVLLVIGQPMTADGFADLIAELGDRTVVAYDPRGLGRSTRSDGSALNDPRRQAEDLHALIAELGGPVEMFASSGGAVTALALLAAHPEDLTRVVAHEPPVLGVLPDAGFAERANEVVGRAYQERGWGAGLAAFIALSSWQGEFTEDYFDRALPEPEQFGLPGADDGTREDPLLSGASAPVTDFEPDLEALRGVGERLVLAVGEQTGEALTARSTRALAARLGLEPVTFPGDHGGFAIGNPAEPGDPAAFAARLREVLATGRD
ncbi:alpha/beta fold hydrolase [Brachybacterium sp. J153]|uniref:alpha/beta fold hydrolase n=1 Tax=Brachybacterium sp. J153 TaxID=3116488 RepID=UPI002E75B883|nr:alpha/beta hydrolase [Brachybacterium sp. J153]MEE1616835.1 alpha/beta hydrolase [Brachybacterium sp. J153]